MKTSPLLPPHKPYRDYQKRSPEIYAKVNADIDALLARLAKENAAQ